MPRKVEKRGRNKKFQDEISSGLGVVEALTSLEEHEGNQLMLLPTKFSEPHGVMTMARSALLTGNYKGMWYDCADEIALNQIMA